MNFIPIVDPDYNVITLCIEKHGVYYPIFTFHELEDFDDFIDKTIEVCNFMHERYEKSYGAPAFKVFINGMEEIDKVGQV